MSMPNMPKWLEDEKKKWLAERAREAQEPKSNDSGAREWCAYNHNGTHLSRVPMTHAHAVAEAASYTGVTGNHATVGPWRELPPNWKR